MRTVLEQWDELDHQAATAEILPCNGSRAWAAAMAGHRPFDSEKDLLAAADKIWAALPATDWQEAFASHPRLGERHATVATARSLAWSAGEQSGVAAEQETASALAEANQLYEQQFGRVFLVCATGKSTPEILSLLQRRMRNDLEAEMAESGEQQRRITQLRLRKWLGLAVARCEDV